jgi:hypothetical protein
LVSLKDATATTLPVDVTSSVALPVQKAPVRGCENCSSVMASALQQLRLRRIDRVGL